MWSSWWSYRGHSVPLTLYFKVFLDPMEKVPSCLASSPPMERSNTLELMNIYAKQCRQLWTQDTAIWSWRSSLTGLLLPLRLAEHPPSPPFLPPEHLLATLVQWTQPQLLRNMARQRGGARKCRCQVPLWRCKEGSFFSDTNRLANHFWPVSLFLQTRGLLVTRLPPKQNRTMNRLPSHVPQANTTQRWPLHFFFWFNRSKYFWRATNCPSNLRLIQSEEPLVLHNLTSCRSLHDQNIFRSLTRHVMASKLGYLWSTE